MHPFKNTTNNKHKQTLGRSSPFYHPLFHILTFRHFRKSKHAVAFYDTTLNKGQLKVCLVKYFALLFSVLCVTIAWVVEITELLVLTYYHRSSLRFALYPYLIFQLVYGYCWYRTHRETRSVYMFESNA
jgi:hypothetical protein